MSSNELQNLKGKVILVSGPSGVGKGTVIRMLKEKFPEFVFPLSGVTRKMRAGEKNGEVYEFMSKDEFELGIKNGMFLEWAFVHGKNYYGTLKKPILDALKDGKIVVREVDIQGVHSIIDILPKENLVTIFLKPKDNEDLISRIVKRGKLPADEMNRRMESASKELKASSRFDYQVFNLDGEVDKCFEEVVDIIKKESKKAGLNI